MKIAILPDSLKEPLDEVEEALSDQMEELMMLKLQIKL
jgi:galactose-1-phosphate uridylyltransferase